MKSTILALLLLTACSSSLEAIDQEAITLADFEPQLRCQVAWHDIVEEWRDSGGIFLPSAADTKRQIERGTSTRLESIFKTIWEQLNDQPIVDRVELGSAFLASARSVAPTGCLSSVWLVEELSNNDLAISDDLVLEIKRRFQEEDELLALSSYVDALMAPPVTGDK